MHQLLESTIKTILDSKPDPFLVRKSTAFVALHSHFVSIDEKNIAPIANVIREKIDKNNLLTQNQFGSLKNSPQLVFLQDAINFCFWAGKNEVKWTVEYPKRTFSDGWYGLTNSFERAIEEKIPILDASFLENLTLKDAKHIFRGAKDTKIPLLEERVEFLKSAGRILNKKFGGKAENIVKEADSDGVKIVQKILDNFPFFRDYATQGSKKIFFLKRAQICAYDLSLLKRERIKNIEQLTIFADYKLPQLLRFYKVIHYKKELAKKIDSYTLLEKDSQEEIEIRAVSIWACELIAQYLNVSPALLDNALWQASQAQKSMKPYHRVLTTNY